MIETGIAIFFAGSLMAMMVYHVILFLLYRRGREYIYLALLCAGIMLRSLTLNSNGIPLQALVPVLGFEGFKTIEYFCVYGLMAVFPLYFSSIFPNEFPKYLLRLFTAIGIVFSAITLVTTIGFYHSILNLCHLVYLVEIAVVGRVIYKALMNKRPDAVITLAGMGLATPMVVIEIVANSGFFDQGLPFLLELSLLVFLLFQAFILAKRNAKAFYISEMTKSDLEKAIQTQTSELSESNKLKNTLLSIMSHDVKSPLNSIKGFLSLTNSDYLKPEEVRPLTLQLEEQVHNTSMLLDNILHWCASQNRAITVTRTKVHMRPLIDECFSLFRFQARNKQVCLVNDVAGGYYVLADENIMRLVIRNLVSNALKFSHEGGYIKADFHQSGPNSFVVIEDNGVGIARDKLPALFDIDKNVSTAGTRQEVGTGLGLSLCKKFLHAMGSEIMVQSTPGSGSKFFIQIPVAQISPNRSPVMYVQNKVA